MALLEVKKLTHNFKGLIALNNLSIEVRPGEILGIIGPNGAGKTTLFNVITGFLKPSAGEILFQGEAIGDLKPYDIVKKGLVRTFQGAGLFQQLSCLQNVVLAHQLHKKTGFWQTMLDTKEYRKREEEVYGESVDILKGLDLEDKKDLPVKDIPYGHQKMLGLAMARATNAKLLLLDEPVAGMNPAESVTIVEEVRRLRDEQEKTIAIVEHNMKVIMGVCDRIIVLNHGIKIAEGTPDLVKKDERVIEAYLGAEEV